jgi:serine/threonine-protein kinase RsbW
MITNPVIKTPQDTPGRSLHGNWARATSTWPLTPVQVREARQFLSAILDGRPADADAILCLSELVTNATMHSRSRELDGYFCVRVQLRGSHLRVEVSDQGGPWAHPAHTNGRNGRGLLIVDQRARAWGRTGNDQTGWTIWLEMECW